MEIEKLIEKLRTESLYKDKATLEIMDLCMDAVLALEQLQAENDRLKEEVRQMRWIPVEERLPEEKQRVIVRCERVGTSVGWILWGNWMTDIGPGAGKVIHWMHLPKAPKEGKKR